MPAKKGKAGAVSSGDDPPDKKDEPKTPDTRKRMSSGEIEVDASTGMLIRQEDKVYNATTKRWVGVETSVGMKLLIPILRNEVSDLRTQLEIADMHMREIVLERDALQNEVELLRIAVKYADKQDSEIYILEETIVEKDKKIAELLNAQVIIADASLLAENGEDNTAGVDPTTPSSSSGLSPKFDNLSVCEPDESDSD